MTDTTAPQGKGLLDSFFKLSAHGTNVRTEIIAGVTTFLTMAYIIFVNPQILATTGMDQSAVFVATCLAAALGCAIMAFYANWPIAMAPGMGLNAFFAFTVVGAMGFTWQQALGAVELQGEEAEADQDHQEAGPRHSGTRQDDPDEYHEEAEDDDGRAVDDVALLVARLALLELDQQLWSVVVAARHVGSP